MRNEFTTHVLNETGLKKAREIGEAFSLLLDSVESIVTVKDTGRELAIIRTKLEEAAFFVKRAMAKQQENQA